MSNAGVSVMILNWNGKRLLEECLPSVTEAAGAYPGECEIVIVDNGSTDGSVAFLGENYPQIQLKRLPKNTGYQKGCNYGIAECRHEYIVRLDNDVAVEPDFIKPLVDHLISDDQVFATGPKVYYWDRKRLFCTAIAGQFSRGRFYQLFAVRNGVDLCGKLAPSIYLSGGSVAFKKKYFGMLGGFDLIYHPIYWEDFDLCYRAWKRGWKALYVPESVVYHKISATMGSRVNRRRRQFLMYRNYYLFLWSCITDSGLLRSHINKLGRNIFEFSRAMAQKRGYGKWRSFWLEMKAFFAALLKLPAVRKKWRREKSVQKLTDTEVLRLSSYRRPPEITGIEPSAIQSLTRSNFQENGVLKISVHGNNFTSTDVVCLDDLPLDTNFVNSGLLTASVLHRILQGPDTYSLIVTDLARHTGLFSTLFESQPWAFEVN